MHMWLSWIVIAIRCHCLHTVLTRARSSPVVGQTDETRSPVPFHSPSYTPHTSPAVGMSSADNIFEALLDRERVEPSVARNSTRRATIMIGDLRFSQFKANTKAAREAVVVRQWAVGWPKIRTVTWSAINFSSIDLTWHLFVGFVLVLLFMRRNTYSIWTVSHQIYQPTWAKYF